MSFDSEYPISFTAYLQLQMKEVSQEHTWHLLNALVELGYNPQEFLTPEKVYRHWDEFGYGNHFRERVKARAGYINDACAKRCGDTCEPHDKTKGCLLTIEDIHRTLQDGPGQLLEEKRELLSDPEELEMLLSK